MQRTEQLYSIQYYSNVQEERNRSYETFVINTK